MKHTIKKTLDIVIIVILGWLCYQTHTINDELSMLADIEYRFDQVTQHGTLCNIEHFTNDLDK